MLKRHTFGTFTIKSPYRSYSSNPHHLKPIQTLSNPSVACFRQHAFDPALPAVLPRGHFSSSIPAIRKWFTRTSNHHPSLCDDYLLGTTTNDVPDADPIVPLELTRSSPAPPSPHSSSFVSFHRLNAPFSLFIHWTRTACSNLSGTERLYLAQASLDDLPSRLRHDIPTPELVLRTGKGDVYDTNIWIGLAPTYTPLHRDPNPNLFVQLAGTKVVRLCTPETGAHVFGQVQRKLGKSGSAAIRGEEMMFGQEKVFLEEAVWGCSDGAGGADRDGVDGIKGNDGKEIDEESSTAYHGHVFYETTLRAGDGLFIPKGWWHSIKGVGEGVTGSVNWWFR